MIDFGFDKIALVGAIALIVIGPEKLPRVARTVGHFVGKAQRYVAEVKAEVNRTIELEELQKMKKEFESTARDVKDTVEREVHEARTAVESQWQEAKTDWGADIGTTSSSSGALLDAGPGLAAAPLSTPPLSDYKPPRKNWRVKRSAMPAWYKQRHGVRAKALSGAARVAKYRPRPVR
jgi:sec-independent protein translocase protein TatB